ncbi:MAG: FCD domain-containing protein [Lachnospiraceae bacterium]|nr:FCD domain-containing protein [Lachnospiraceae bacterium]
MSHLKKGQLLLSDEVYNDIFLKIIRGELIEGEKLPSETQLCKIYGVSRVSVRAALQKLQSVGYVITRQGVGSFVHDINAPKEWDEISVFGKDSFKNFFELRQAVEFKAMELCVKNITEKDKKYLLSLVDLMRKCAASHELPLFIDYDLEFHMYIIHTSQNPFFIEIMERYKGAYHQYLSEMAKQSPKTFSAIAEEHQQIYDLLAAKKIRAVQKYLYNNNLFYEVTYFSK